MIRKFLLSILFAAAFIITGAVTASAEKVTLQYWIWDGNQQAAMQASADEFMKQNPDISVQISVIEWNDYWTKITTGVASGTLPDVFWGHLAYFSGLITKGALMDLTPMIKRDNINLKQYYQSLVQNWNYQGKQYGIPKDWDTICIFYNKDLFDKAGIAYPSDRLSWNPADGGEYLKILQKLTIDANGKNVTQTGFDKNNIVQFGTAGITGENIQEGWLNFVWQNGGKGVIDKPYGTQFVMDDPKTEQALQFFANLASKYNVAPYPGTQAYSQFWWELFAAGKAAMCTGGSWNLSSARSTLKFKWDVSFLPKGPAGRFTCFNGLAHVIAAKTKYPEQAWKFAKWMDSPESQKIISSYAVVFPAIPGLMPIYLKAAKGNPPHIKDFIDETASSGMWPMHVNWNQAFDIIQRELGVAIAGTESVETAVNKIKPQVTPLFAQH